MANSIDILKAAILTPQIITEESRDSEEILLTLMAGDDCASEKLQALMARPEVTGFQAHKLLKISSKNIKFFEPLRDIYIKKFILTGNRTDSLRYAVMTAHLWIHFNPSADKTQDAQELLPKVGPVIVACLKRWPSLKSAVRLLNILEKNLSEGYNEKSRFPGDDYAPFEYIWNRNVPEELKKYIYPFIGRTMVELCARDSYYRKPQDLLALSTRDYFANPNLVSPTYIKSIENAFTLKDIQPFISQPGDNMEKFLLSETGKAAGQRFGNLCQQAPVGVLAQLQYYIKYATFEFSSNRAFQALSLEAKADFLNPIVNDRLRYNHNQQLGLLYLWINDPEWNNPNRTISELTWLALEKRHLFTHQRTLFKRIMANLLQRRYAPDVLPAANDHQEFLWAVYSGEYLRDARYPADFKKPGLLLATLQKLDERLRSCKIRHEEIGYTTDQVYLAVWAEVEVQFVALLAACLPDYNTEEACLAVRLAEAANNPAIIQFLLTRELSFHQVYQLFCQIQSEEAEKPAAELLRQKMVDLIKAIAYNRERLTAGIYLLASFGERLKPSPILAAALGPNCFDLSFLLSMLQDIMKDGSVVLDGFPPSTVSAEVKESVREMINLRLETEQKTPEEAKLFCQHPVFAGSYHSWRWYYGQYPLTSLIELGTSGLSQDDLSKIFATGKQREHLLAAWQATPFKEVPISFTRDYSLKLHQHPGWADLSLQDRLNLFTPDNRREHDSLLVSLAVGFAALWEQEKWTPERYLQEIKRIDPDGYESSKFATLAVNLL